MTWGTTLELVNVGAQAVGFASVPFLLTMTVWLPIAIPYSALNALVTTLYSRMPSTPSVVPASEAAAAPPALTIGAPSSVKLFDRTGAPLALNHAPVALAVPPVVARVCGEP